MNGHEEADAMIAHLYVHWPAGMMQDLSLGTNCGYQGSSSMCKYAIECTRFKMNGKGDSWVYKLDRKGCFTLCILYHYIPMVLQQHRIALMWATTLTKSLHSQDWIPNSNFE